MHLHTEDRPYQTELPETAHIQEVRDPAARAEEQWATELRQQETRPATAEVRQTTTLQVQAAITAVHRHRRQDRPDTAQAVAEDTAEAVQAAEAMAEAAEAVPAEVEEDNKPLRLRHYEKDIDYNSADNDRNHRSCTERI